MSKGVWCFIFISLIKVNGEVIEDGCLYRVDDEFWLIDFYGLFKLEVERGFLDLVVRIGIEVVIICLVLVYGLGVKVNFFNMMKVINKRILFFFFLVDN